MFEQTMKTMNYEDPFKKIITPSMTQADLEMMLESSLRYALGRYTYIPGWTAEIITRFIPEVSERCLHVMRKDLREHLSSHVLSYPNYCHDILDGWIRLADRIEDELGRRGAYEWMKK